MRTLLIAELGGDDISPATLCALDAANQLGAPVDLLLAGDAIETLAEQACQIPGVARVRMAQAPWLADGLAEEWSELVKTLVDDYSHVLCAATSMGKDLMPRLAGQLGVPQVSDITGLDSPDTFIRPIYAGNAFAKVQAKQSPVLITVRASAFERAPSSGGQAELTTVTAPEAAGLTRLVSDEVHASERPELTSARVVISGGRGLGSAENFHLVEQLADKLGAAIGASRAAVDAGYVANELQVGQTGKVVAPELYIALGISGAIQHLAGMKESKVIVAINKDPDAPIFEVADYGLVADLFEAVPALLEKL